MRNEPNLYFETESGTTLLVVGYKSVPDSGQLENHAPVSFRYIWVVYTYVVTEGIQFVRTSQSNVGKWSLNGIMIDLESMSDEELRAAIEQPYIKFINQK